MGFTSFGTFSLLHRLIRAGIRLFSDLIEPLLLVFQLFAQLVHFPLKAVKLDLGAAANSRQRH